MRVFRAACGLVAVVLLLGAGAAVAGPGDTGRIRTSVRLSAPTSVPAGSATHFDVRLLTADGPVSNRPVRLQRQDPRGWVQVASVTTDRDGLGHVTAPVTTSARFRAFFREDSAYAASTSREIVVTAVTTLGQRAVAEAERHKGQAYQYGAAGPTRFDCSGFTRYVYSRLGRSLPHNAAAQHDATKRVANSAKRPGDLIFTSRGGQITHVGLYAGGSSMWSPVQTGDHVRLQSFSGRTYSVGRVG
jgi:cell wall-associated NlpC family hydrolase